MRQQFLLLSLSFICFASHAQYVGIATSSPTATLDVNGRLRVRGGTPGTGKVLTSDVNGLANWSTVGIVQPNTFVFSEQAGDANLINNGYTQTGSVTINTQKDNTITTLTNRWTQASRFLEARISPVVINGAGNKFVVFGGSEGGGEQMNGGIYDPVTDSWETIPDIGDGLQRVLPMVAWCGGKLVVWGGYIGERTYTNTGRVYDPSTKSWTQMSTTNAPSARWLAAHAYNPATNSLVIWGGETYSGTSFGNGAKYNVSTNTWTTVSTTNAPSPRSLMGFATNGNGELFITCGIGNAGVITSSMHLYNINTDTWTTVQGFLTARYSTQCVWTGTQYLVWGGVVNGVNVSDGGRYDPVANAWLAFSAVFAPPSYGAKVAYGNGRFAVVGPSSSAYYRPATNTWYPIASNPSFNFGLAANNLVLFAVGGASGYNSSDRLNRDANRYFWSAQQTIYKSTVPQSLYLYRKN